jgi:hypothetical protein
MTKRDGFNQMFTDALVGKIDLIFSKIRFELLRENKHRVSLSTVRK